MSGTGMGKELVDMKYGRIVYKSVMSGSETRCNLGDSIQILAIDEIYKRMKIGSTDIVNIPIEELKTYCGEKVILPINGYFQYYKMHPSFPTSPDIIPVFLGLHCTTHLYTRYSHFFQAHLPVGCRDEKSFHAMEKCGYTAYLLGCMTLLFPKRKDEPQKPHVFVVDAHQEIEKYIPAEYKKHLEYVSQEMDSFASYEEQEEVAMAYLKRYRDEATLVITSRLHCAVPCIAMGIPVIIVKKSYDSRFAWLDKHIHLYTPDEYPQIDWNPQPIELEEIKEKLFRAAISLISQTPDKQLLEEIHEFYMDRERKKITRSLLVDGYQFLAQIAPKTAAFIREKLLFRYSIMK